MLQLHCYQMNDFPPEYHISIIMHGQKGDLSLTIYRNVNSTQRGTYWTCICAVCDTKMSWLSLV